MLATDLSLALDASLMFGALGLVADPWQADLLRSRPQQAALLCTRQAGKSTTTAALACWTALYEANSLILLLSPGERQSGELFQKVVGFYNALGQPVKAVSATTEHLTLTNGSRIVALPGKEQSIRGYSGVKLLIIDEASRVPDALYYSVRPMLAVSGGRLVVLTTPFGKRGFFHQLWTEGGASWQRFKITAEQCPRITPEFLAEELRSMGGWWYKQEYGCEFVDTVDSVFSYESIMGAMSAGVLPLFPLEVT